MITNGASSSTLTDNSTQCFAKMFEASCLPLEVKQLTTTAYHPQRNGLVYCYNKSLVAWLHHHESEHQKDWDENVQPLTNEDNTQV